MLTRVPEGLAQPQCAIINPKPTVQEDDGIKVVDLTLKYPVNIRCL